MPLPLPLSVAGGDFDLQGALILLLFLGMIALMYTRKISALLALPLLGVGVALLGAVPWGPALREIGTSGFAGAWETLSLQRILITEVIGEGALRMYEPIIITMIGGMLAIMIKEKRIAETLIKFAAELSGDNPIKVAILMMLVISMLFTSMGGLGAIIMTGTIVFPIMMSLGIPPLTAAGIYLIAMSAGGTLNPQSWALYQSALGLESTDVQKFAITMMMLYFSTCIVFIVFNLRRGTRFWATAKAASARTGVRPIALLSPIVPIFLAFQFSILTDLLLHYATQITGALDWGQRIVQDLALVDQWAQQWDRHIGGWHYIGAFAAGLVFVFVTTYERGRPNVQQLTKSMIIGAESVIPAVILMIGLGIVLNGLLNPDVREHLAPYIDFVVPTTPVGYVLIFTALAPMALYRGPLNVWGLGFGVAALIYGTGKIGALPIMAIFMSVGAIQGVCDPTNTHNIWIASYIGEDVMRILKKTIGYVWVMAACGLVIASIMYHGEFGSPLEESTLRPTAPLTEGARGELVLDLVNTGKDAVTADGLIELNGLMADAEIVFPDGTRVTAAEGTFTLEGLGVAAAERVTLSISGQVTESSRAASPRVTIRPNYGALLTLELGPTQTN